MAAASSRWSRRSVRSGELIASMEENPRVELRMVSREARCAADMKGCDIEGRSEALK